MEEDHTWIINRRAGVVVAGVVCDSCNDDLGGRRERVGCNLFSARQEMVKGSESRPEQEFTGLHRKVVKIVYLTVADSDSRILYRIHCLVLAIEPIFSSALLKENTI